MIFHFLKLTFRNLLKNRLYVAINILGLGTTLACCIVAYLNWDYNARFDSHHLNADKVYRVNFTRLTQNVPIGNGNCPWPLGQNIRETIGQVEKVVRVYPTGGNFKVGDDLFVTSLSGVDPEFFEVFTFDMVSGESSSIMDKTTILISKELQEKYFPEDENPVGEALTYISGEKRIDYQVGGVFAMQPQNSSFYGMDAYIHYDNILDLYDWEPDNWELFNSTFVTIPNPSNVETIESQLQNYIDIQNIAKPDFKVHRYYLDPFPGMAVRSEKSALWNHWFNESLPAAAATAPGIMALLILLIACFNFTNTSIAIANQRIKEIGVRKVMGSTKRQLIFQFLGENLILCFLALLFGLAVAAFLVPQYSAMWAFLDIKLSLLDNAGLLIFLAGLLLITGLLAGSYPAFYISSFQPNTIFRGTVKFSGTNNLTRILLSLQFAISLIAIISAFVFNNNAKYQAEYDLGFDMMSVAHAYVKDEQGYRTMRNGLEGYDQIREMAGSRHSVTSSWYTDPIKVETREMDVNVFEVGHNYLNTIGATIVEGRDFMENSQTDAKRSVIINEELAKTLGWSDPVNQRMVLRDTAELYVIGVVKNIYFEGGLWDPLEPMIMRFVMPEDYRFFTVSADAKDVSAVKNIMDQQWKEVFPDEISTVRLLQQDLSESREINMNIKSLFLFLGIIAVLLSAIGLFSLVSLNLNKKKKEIGIRKVLGASMENLAMRISREFVIILIIASVVGSVSGYFLADLLMGSIWAYYVPISPWTIAISVFILILVSFLTIGRKVIKATASVPINFLRDE